MKLVVRMRDGKELPIECEECEIQTSEATGCIVSYNITGVKGPVFPLYMPPGDIALVWREGEKNIAGQE